jgi:hypothetical protein
VQAFYAIKQPCSGDEIKGTLPILASKENTQRILHNHANGLFRRDINTQVLRTYCLYFVCCGIRSEFQSSKMGADCRCRGS